LAPNVLASNVQFAAYLWGDSSTHDAGGYHLALRWSGKIVASPYRMSVVSGYGFAHLVGVLYYIFGRNQLLIQLVTSVDTSNPATRGRVKSGHHDGVASETG